MDEIDALETLTVAKLRTNLEMATKLAAKLGITADELLNRSLDRHGKTLVKTVLGESWGVITGGVREVFDEGGATGVEEEDVGVPSPAHPYDPEKIRVEPKTFSLRQVVDMIADGDLDLAPEFQRQYVWKVRQKVRLIESVLLRIPLPAFYFSANSDGKMNVVDGVQRLSTIRDFVHEKFSLTAADLEYLKVSLLMDQPSPTADACSFSQLDGVWKRRLHQTSINANVIDPQTPEQVKFDIFKRLNTGGSPLNAQEIRHSMMKNRTRIFLADLCVAKEFLDVVPEKIHQNVRMVDREVALRYLAFVLAGGPEGYPAEETLDSFLIEAVKKLDDPKKVSDTDLDKHRSDFRRAMQSAAILFGDHAFRKWPENNNRSFPFNKALFESWAFALRHVEPQRVAERRSAAVEEIRKLMLNREYDQSITLGTGDKAKVNRRFSLAKELVDRHFG